VPGQHCPEQTIPADSSMPVAQESHFGLTDLHHGFAIQQHHEVVARAMPLGERPVPHAAQSSMG
jgi:hypothetical protein